MTPAVSVVLPRDVPAGDVLAFAAAADEAGFARVWVVEDLGFRGGFAQAGAVLAATRRIGVGIGIVPAAARVLEFAAMEAATLAQLFPGRLALGVGHGMPGWMRSVGAWPASPLGELERTLAGVRSLLAGGRSDHGVALEPSAVPSVPPPVLAGVRGPRSLAASARVADGTILAEPVTEEYLARVRGHLGPVAGHRLVAYHLACVREDRDEAIDAVRPALAPVGGPDWAPHVDPLPFGDELHALREASGSDEAFAAALPVEWIERLALAGTVTDVRERLRSLTAAGVDEHVLVPVGESPLDELGLLAGLL